MDTIGASHTRGAGEPVAATTGRLAATTNNKSVKVINGSLVAEPYATSATGIKKSKASLHYGAINTILNPPNADRVSTYNSHYNMTTRTMQTAGTVNKRPVPYSQNAFRNRLKGDDFKPNTGTSIKFEAGVANRTTHPYRTIKSAAEAPTVKPMHARRGFTNSFITAEMSKRWHKTLWAQ